MRFNFHSFSISIHETGSRFWETRRVSETSRILIVWVNGSSISLTSYGQRNGDVLSMGVSVGSRWSKDPTTLLEFPGVGNRGGGGLSLSPSIGVTLSVTILVVRNLCLWTREEVAGGGP